MPIGCERFTWQDGERTIHFGRGALEEASGSLGEGFTLLTTARARDMAPELAERAGMAYDVAAGRVDEVAGTLLAAVAPARLIVALGGGRTAQRGERVSRRPPTAALIGASMPDQRIRGASRVASLASA